MTLYSDSFIKEKLSEQLQPDYIEVQDLSDGCGMKFSVVVASSQFEGKALLQRHRMVNDILSEEMKTVHALTLKTYTPDQWEKLKSS